MPRRDDGVTRRDFLNGIALAIAAGIAPGMLLAPRRASATSPPAATGFQGSAPGSYEVAHDLRDGKRYDLDRVAVSERVDLVVVAPASRGLPPRRTGGGAVRRHAS